MRVRLFIGLALVLMVSGVALALPTDDGPRIWWGAALCWAALVCLWTARKVQS